jgi:phage terminase large subunit-like protein
LPEDTARQHRRKPYLQWINSGDLIAIPGAVIEYDFIIEKILQLKTQFDLQSVHFDRWGAESVRQALESEGVVMVGHGQGYKDQSAPTKELLKLILSRKLRHNGDPVLRWCVSNLTTEADAAGNLKPSKRRSVEKIDAAIAAIMALAGGLLLHEDAFVSAYENMTKEEILAGMCF